MAAKVRRLTATQVMRLVTSAEEISSVVGRPISSIVAGILGIDVDADFGTEETDESGPAEVYESEALAKVYESNVLVK